MPNGPFLEAFEKPSAVEVEKTLVEVPAEVVEEPVVPVVEAMEAVFAEDLDYDLSAVVVEEPEVVSEPVVEPPKAPTKTRGRKKKGE